MHFPSHFIKLLMSCITSVSYSVFLWMVFRLKLSFPLEIKGRVILCPLSFCLMLWRALGSLTFCRGLLGFKRIRFLWKCFYFTFTIFGWFPFICTSKHLSSWKIEGKFFELWILLWTDYYLWQIQFVFLAKRPLMSQDRIFAPCFI